MHFVPRQVHFIFSFGKPLNPLGCVVWVRVFFIFPRFGFVLSYWAIKKDTKKKEEKRKYLVINQGFHEGLQSEKKKLSPFYFFSSKPISNSGQKKSKYFLSPPLPPLSSPPFLLTITLQKQTKPRIILNFTEITNHFLTNFIIPPFWGRY